MGPVGVAKSRQQENGFGVHEGSAGVAHQKMLALLLQRSIKPK